MMALMPRQIFDFDPPDSFAPDAVGEPGDRTFYLRARAGGRTVTVSLEKVQVALLAERIVALLNEVRRRGIEVGDEARQMPDASIAADESAIVSEDFRAGTLALAWEVEGGRVMVEAREMRPGVEDEPDEIDDEDPTGPDLLRVHLAPPEALGFVERANELVAAGRPPCPVCGQPLDPQGHLCPRRNGYLN